VTLILPASTLTSRPAQEPIAICHRRWHQPIPTSSVACRAAGLTCSMVVLARDALKLSESIVAMCGVERFRQEVVRELPVGCQSIVSAHATIAESHHSMAVSAMWCMSRTGGTHPCTPVVGCYSWLVRYSVLCIVDRRKPMQITQQTYNMGTQLVIEIGLVHL
jgi:hypothetical protein